MKASAHNPQGAPPVSLSRVKQRVSRAPGPPRPPAEDFQSTCVFMLLFNATDPQVLFVQKADTEGYPWRNQVALPGGHVDATDKNARQAAFRELREELNIPREQVEYVGSIGHFQTINAKDIEVFVGLWDQRGPLRHDPAEIARVLPVPLHLLAAMHATSGFKGRSDLTVQDLVYPFQDVVIWGVTAKILHYFLELI